MRVLVRGDRERHTDGGRESESLKTRQRSSWNREWVRGRAGVEGLFRGQSPASGQIRDWTAVTWSKTGSLNLSRFGCSRAAGASACSPCAVGTYGGTSGELGGESCLFSGEKWGLKKWISERVIGSVRERESEKG